MHPSPKTMTGQKFSRKRERELIEANLIYTQALCDVLKDQVQWHTCGRYRMGLSRLGDCGGGLVILVQTIKKDRFVYCYRLDEFLKKAAPIYEELIALKAIAAKAAAG